MRKYLLTLAILFFSSLAFAQSNQRLNVAGNLSADTLVAKVIKREDGTSSQILLANGASATAGTGISISNGVISSTVTIPPAVEVADATSSTNGIIRLAGDLSGTAASPTVRGLSDKLNSTDTLKTVRLTGSQNITGVKTFSNGFSSSKDVKISSLSLGKGLADSTNTLFGYNALRINEIGVSNTAIGYEALSFGTRDGLTAVGFQSLKSNSTGYENTALGNRTLPNNTSGYGNTAIGFKSMESNISGGENVAVGTNALWKYEAGHLDNVAVGYKAMEGGSIGTAAQFNVAVGAYALQNNASGHNVAVGYQALMSNSGSTPQHNTAVGSTALVLNSSGVWNTAFGSGALQTNTTGSRNVSLGMQSNRNNTVGTDNIAIGQRSFLSNVSGSYNIVVGNLASNNVVAPNNTSGFYNVIMGHSGLRNFVSGNSNTAIGDSVGFNFGSGSRNILIGKNASFGASGNNRLVIGNAYFGTNIYDSTRVTLGIGTLNPQASLHVKGNIRSDSTITGTSFIRRGGTKGEVMLADGTLTSAGTAGQVLTYTAGSTAPTWQGATAVRLHSTIYTFSGTGTIAAAPALTERVDDLNLNLSSSGTSISNFVAGGIYEITITARLRTGGGVENVNAYFSLTPGAASAATSASYGNGVAVSVLRTSNVPASDFTTNSATEIFEATASTSSVNINAYSSSSSSQQSWSGTIIIRRVR